MRQVPAAWRGALVLGIAGLVRGGAACAALPPALARWLNPDTAPFIPVPEIDVDPNSGTTLGLIPTWLVTNSKAQITKIIAPDVIHNPFFGWGVHGRIFAYPSKNTQWSVVASVEQRVESQFDYEFQTGLLRDSRWSFDASVVYDRNGTPRFYGIGNNSPIIDETNYTKQQKYIETTLGWNFTQVWQLAWTMRVREVAIQPGTLAKFASIQTRFAGLLGIGANHEILNRIEISRDTRNDLTIPTRGGAYVLFGGVAASHGAVNDSLYSVVGFDGRQFWPLNRRTTLAAHVALRYMPGEENVPFWSLSSIGGDRSVLGEEQPLRGYGAGRFYGRNSFSASVEYRRRVLSLNAMATHIEIELTPFIDLGEVFANPRTLPFTHLHHVFGLGFRGIAPPFVVGYVDVGVGSEGPAVFTGINYPF
ncbi:MAG TPA: BamA/TamA family outer membrane protein [Steroidobacteraceae bacterium]|nr:BamA/TamA family outer membrane protein [Steroidobacteraceae bacterium]